MDPIRGELSASSRLVGRFTVFSSWYILICVSVESRMGGGTLQFLHIAICNIMTAPVWHSIELNAM